MRRFISTIIVFLAITAKLHAQIGGNDPEVNDSLIKILIKRHIAINTIKQSMPGYRVQIYFGGNRAKANDMKNEFTRLFPDIPSYLIYQQPNFKVRVGDCKTHLEAMKILSEIRAMFETAFIVKDDVKLPVIN